MTGPAESANLTREAFLRRVNGALGSLIGLAMSIPVVAYLLSPLVQKQSNDWQTVARTENIEKGLPQAVMFNYKRVDGWLQVYERRTVFVTREAGDRYTVFSSRCTHLACNVRWSADERVFECPCHGGVFDETGAVTAGPPPAPLTVLESRVEEGRLQIRRIA